MKKLLFSFVLLALPVLSYASKADLFSYDVQKVKALFVNADALDHFVEMNRDINLLEKINPAIANWKNNASESINLFDKGPEKLMGIPPFWWGFFLNWVGVLLVYLLTDHNKEYTRDALIGFLVGTVIYVGFYFCWWGSWLW